MAVHVLRQTASARLWRIKGCAGLHRALTTATSASNPIILYDIKSKLDPQAWSPNTWKARFALNYKRLPYKTVWVSYPDIAAKLSSLGLEPLSSGAAPYTLPVIADPTHSGTPTIVRDSFAIAQYLDVTYPELERPLLPAGTHAFQALFLHHASTRITPTLRPLLVPLAPAILDAAALPYFYRTREASFGRPLAEVRPSGTALEEAWSKVEKEFGVLDSILQKNDVHCGGNGGDLVLGNRVSFADFVLAGLFVWMSKFNPGEDGNPWERIRSWHGGRWERLWKGCEEFMEVK
ncbi:hypothetical protein BOTBODRAFT_127701 [Botryobasidium botryosum FD-172 SS1]|uniref:GST N-terminal domain-containing protein n=1 Tax=Botryobasidium botryosum (strain FD-172 SS1) TaxID=930990 RepID=A0A067MT23_BOTB1|nr:hypothetical protein BOTBODRAFT_127701 [Botryobasidium botryosum FD-172 SS1]